MLSVRSRLGLAVWLFLAVPLAWAQPPAGGPKFTLDHFLARGADFEQQQLWQQAVEVYERALRVYPERGELRDRWRHAERRFSLSRRYHDPSFTGDLLGLSQNQALELYAEVLRKIQSYYVEGPDLGKLVDGGYRNLDLALGEDVFLDKAFSPRQREAARAARRSISLSEKPTIDNVDAATAAVARVADRCAQLDAQCSVAVILEFLTAASEGLDPYSTHLSPNRLRDLYSMIDGNFVGLGVEVKGGPGGLVIVDVLDDSPAKDASLADGETIVEVDGRSLLGLSPEEAANTLQGQAGSVARLAIRDKHGAQRRVSVVRREVVVHSVCQARLLDTRAGVGYVRLTSFQKQTARELEEAVDTLKQQGMRGLIVDLRGNPGGLLDTALHVANHFLDAGVLVSTQGRSWGQNWSHRARPMAVWTMPLAVLVDGESASASEIFAGAMQDHGRGVIVGARTFGKGSVQSIFPLRAANTGLRLTTAHFYSPKGKVYQGVGVTPDEIVHRPVGSIGEEIRLPRAPDPGQDPQLARAIEVVRARTAPEVPVTPVTATP